ncbi:MAG: DUF871 domain-containing protein [Ketobacter sp.]|nr:DUF871 domain-containing protein [Ketobacter sp.]
MDADACLGAIDGGVTYARTGGAGIGESMFYSPLGPINNIGCKPTQLYLTTTVEDIKAQIDEAVSIGASIIFYSHDIVETEAETPSGAGWYLPRLIEVLEYAQSKGVVVPFHELMKRLEYQQPVLTHTAATSVQYPYSDSVFNQDEGYAVFDWEPQYDALAGGRGVLSLSDATSGVIYEHATSGYLATHDGTSLKSLLEAHVAGRRYRTVTRWNTELNEKQIGVLDIDGDGDWNWSTTSGYDGEFAYGSVINLFKGNDQVNKLHALQIYNKDQTTEQIEARHGVVVAVVVTYLADFSDIANSFLMGAV